MDKTVLGISAFYHDSAAALVKNGKVIAAAQEERFTRKKFDPRFPIHAINYCLEEAFVELEDLDAIVYYDNPLLTFDRVFKTIVATAPHSAKLWESSAKSIFGVKMKIRDIIKDRLNCDVPIYFTQHHAAHAASAFYPSPYSEAAFLTLDGVGEWDTTTIGKADHNGIKILKAIQFPHSLGLLYSAFTYFIGFKVNSGEYKMMGLAPYGDPIYVDLIKNNLINIKADGSFSLNMEYFNYMHSNQMITEKFSELFKGDPRHPDERITKREMDMAASIQIVLEEVVIKLARTAKQLTNSDNLVLAGGVALNCVANGKLKEENIFKNIWIQPAAGDAGGAVGAALLLSYEKFGQEKKTQENGRDFMFGSYLGPAYSNEEIKAFLERTGAKYSIESDPDKRSKAIAQFIANGKVVGYFNGQMEYGPRALGARSILGDPRNAETQVNMNLKIKYRESFRPFAPSVMYDKVNDYFELDTESPYMLLVAKVNKDRQLDFDLAKLKTGNEIDMLEIVKKERSDIPAITHIDYSARIQTVHPDDKPDYYNIMSEFHKITGYGVIVNTSFNVRGEPIVNTPQEAFNCFVNTEMDVLVMEDFVLHKKDQKFEKNEEELQSLLDEDSRIESKEESVEKNHKAITEFYSNHLAKINPKLVSKISAEMHSAAREKESTFIPLNIDKNYLNADALEFVEELNKLWSIEGNDFLVELLPEIIKLSEKLKQKDYTEEVSPYIYAMF